MDRKYIIPSVIAVTTLPFLLLFLTIDYSASSEAVIPQVYGVGASILGLMGATILFWQFFFGSRYFTSLVTPNVIWVNSFHRKVGKYAIFLILLHPLTLAFGVVKEWWWLLDFTPANEVEEHILYGKLALLTLSVIWITSVLVRSKLKYRPWRYIHYLGYLLMFFVFLHAGEIGAFLNSMPYLRFWWNTLQVLFYLTVAYRIVRGFGVGRKEYVLSKKEAVGKTIVLLSFTPKGKALDKASLENLSVLNAPRTNSGLLSATGKVPFSRPLSPISRLRGYGKHIVPAVGQYGYIQLKRFGESHPYTIMEFEAGTGVLTLGVKDVGSFSRKLQELSLGAIVRFDGPYGVFTREAQNTEPKVVIAGGIGITPFVRMLQLYGNNTIFMHANRKIEDIVRRDVLRQAVGEGYYDIIDEETGVSDSHTRRGRADEATIKELVGSEYLKRNYFVCGSPGFILAMRAQLEKMGVSKKQIFFESLGY